MKARSKELLDRAVAATIAAIEIYNKPDFQYREETFSVLAVNGWELLLKAKWLQDHKNKITSLYVTEPRKKRDGSNSRKLQFKLTRSKNPFTHSLDFLGKKLVDSGALNHKAWANIEALVEMRDSSIHFYNRSGPFPVRLQEIGTASLKNFVATIKEWFGRDMSEFNFYLMPLSFIALPSHVNGILLNAEERNFLSFVESLESEEDDATSPYSVTVNIDIKFTRSKAKDALGVQITNNPNAPEVRLSDEQIKEKYPWDYDRLTKECRTRYSDFKLDTLYHQRRNALISNEKFCHVRFLDPGNREGSKKRFFSPNILQEFDRFYKKT